MADDAAGRFSELASRYVQDNVRLWQRYASALQKVTESTAAGFTSRAQGAPAPDMAAAGRELVQLNLALYTDLLTTYAEFATRALATVFSTTVGTAPAANPPPAAPASTSSATAETPGPRIQLMFAGPPAQAVSQSFAVANKQAEAIEVTFELSEFVRDGGAPRVRVPVAFTPERFVLPPGQEQVVQCRVPLGNPLVPGSRYMAVVRIAGFPGMDIALIAAPDAAARTRAPQAAPTPVKTTAASSARPKKASAAAPKRKRRA